MKKHIKHILSYVFVALACATFGYFAGADRSYHMGSKSSQAGSLNWFCKIHDQLQQENSKQATDITEAAISSHLYSLGALESETSVDHSTFLSEASSYISSSNIQIDESISKNILANHKQDDQANK